MSNSPRKSRRQKKSLLSKARWVGYAAAGAVTALGANQTAEAGIHYHDIVPDVPLDGVPTINPATYTIDFDGGGTADLRLFHSGFTFNSVSVGKAIAYGLNGARVAAFIGTSLSGGKYPYAYKLQYGELVSAKMFESKGTLAYFNGYGNDQFLGSGPGYIGFSFDAGAGTQYGWVQVDMVGSPHNAFSVLDWAYADPGESITAGQVPEPGSLGLLATGAVGLLLWRLKRRGNQPAA